MREIAREEWNFPVSGRGFDNRYFVAEGAGAEIHLHIQFIDGKDFVQLHLYATGNNREAIRIMRRDRPEFMTMLRSWGIKTFTAIRPDTDDIKKWIKFLLLSLEKDFKVADFKWKQKNYKVISVEVDDGA
ncbi:hypothetical protein [Geobacter sp. SVR]|uniref:hypothetical protein n=1 Tax=Geobacter sp. SVR TaxID=2495594 RepID=UPI00143EF689|nr:hypothetical protein [Geobacter sp. SVR]BCS54784.1 hypothetical protein GSVR_30920 [Geobacter sp. SVR]GCF86408.1 hypothetical protein GSbR_30080 [Geobacter sp. SVR]